MKHELLGVLFVVAACGGGGAGDDDVVSPDAGNDPDAPPACEPGIPARTVFAGGGSQSSGYLPTAMFTSSGETAVVHQYGNGRSTAIWDGTEWTEHVIYSTSSGGWGAETISEIDGRPALLATIDTGSADDNKLRYWQQLSSGDYATGQLVPNTPAVSLANASRYWAEDGRFAAVGIDAGGIQLLSYEHVDGGSWTVQYVHTAPGNDQIMGAGVGVLDDGTAVVESAGAEGFWLHRRTGNSWSQYRQLGTGDMFNAQMVFPPTGTGTAGVAVYTDPVTDYPRGVFASLSDGTSSGGAALIDAPIHFMFSQTVFDPDGAGGTILLWDDNDHTVHTVAFEGTSFLPAQELRPDLVFDSIPSLVQHPCGGLMILHTTRDPLDPAGQEDTILEPLAEFRAQ